MTVLPVGKKHIPACAASQETGSLQPLIPVSEIVEFPRQANGLCLIHELLRCGTYDHVCIKCTSHHVISAISQVFFLIHLSLLLRIMEDSDLLPHSQEKSLLFSCFLIFLQHHSLARVGRVAKPPDNYHSLYSNSSERVAS